MRKIDISLILTNGKIYTLDGRIVEAAAVSKNQIVSLGTSTEIKSMSSSGTQKIDLNGKAVCPGFNDSHLHLLAYGFEMEHIDLGRADSIEETVQISKKYIKKRGKKPGDWIFGAGWGQNHDADTKYMTKEDLDRISTEHPIYFLRICNHTAVVNSLALKMVGAGKGLSIKGGTFEKDASGELNGVIRENALDWFEKMMPQPGKAEIRTAAENAIRDALKFGLTSLQSSDLHHFGSFDDMIELFTSLKDEKKLRIRINEQLYMPEEQQLREYLEGYHNRVAEDDFFRLGPLKLLTDGSLRARTAALENGYSDEPGNRGVLLYPQNELDDMVHLAHRKGMQVFLHAIGDAAIKASIDALEKSIIAVPRPHRHRINHVQVGNGELFGRMAKLGIMADIQPAFVASDWDMAEERLVRERLKTSYAWKTMMERGIRLAGGSDCPTEELNPLRGIYAAIMRKGTDGSPEGGFLPEQALTVEEAVGIYTKGSAYASYDENIKGTLTEGKLADMVILSEDPFFVRKEDIKDIEVVGTIVDGKVEYSNGQLV